MKKETFIKTIDAIKEQLKIDIEISKKLGEVFPNAHTANLLPNNSLIVNALIMLLQEEMNDIEDSESYHSWINWFCFETDFGNKSDQLKAYYKNGKVIPMNNADDLYEYLIKRNDYE